MSTLMIEVSPELEVRLQAQAKIRGIPVEKYLGMMIESLFPMPVVSEGATEISNEEFDAMLDALSEGIDPNLPPLSDEAISRAGIYRDHD
ncbi:MAG TPA: hypothetical protein VFB21_11650 [Chthonomonadaceae bacterium]|nr:hypothetical protein [Chthonomonadaceae bacterium]